MKADIISNPCGIGKQATRRREESRGCEAAARGKNRARQDIVGLSGSGQGRERRAAHWEAVKRDGNTARTGGLQGGFR